MGLEKDIKIIKENIEKELTKLIADSSPLKIKERVIQEMADKHIKEKYGKGPFSEKIFKTMIKVGSECVERAGEFVSAKGYLRTHDINGYFYLKL